MDKEISRRDFIKYSTIGVVGGAIVYGGISSILKNRTVEAAGTSLAITPDSLPEHTWRFVVDIKKCIGCGRCVNACKTENHVAPGPQYNRTWVERYVQGNNEAEFVDSPDSGITGFVTNPQPDGYQETAVRKSFFVPKLCNQCENPPCLQVCPVGATYSTKEGVVLVDRNACIGCRYCVMACPWGVRYVDPVLKIVDKCTWCYHRITKGLKPACVEACPTGARNFGDLKDPDSIVSKLLKENAAGELKPEIGCHAKTLYIGLEKGVR